MKLVKNLTTIITVYKAYLTNFSDHYLDNFIVNFLPALHGLSSRILTVFLSCFAWHCLHSFFAWPRPRCSGRWYDLALTVSVLETQSVADKSIAPPLKLV